MLTIHLVVDNRRPTLMHPYTFFTETPLLENKITVGMHIICYHPYYSCLCIFWPYYPYLLFQFI